MRTRQRRPEADDLLRMSEHRRTMHALRRVAARAAREGVMTATTRPASPAAVPDNVTSLDEARARRTEHTADVAG